MDNYTNYGFGWELKNSGLFFLGKEVSISVDTKVDSEDPDHEIFDEQSKTLDIVTANWNELVAVIKLEITTYENIPEDKLSDIANNPRIWLSMDYDNGTPAKNHGWTFVLGVIDNEDFGWHVEFEGVTHADTWAGD